MTVTIAIMIFFGVFMLLYKVDDIASAMRARSRKVLKAEIKRRLHARGWWNERNPKDYRKGWSPRDLYPGGSWDENDEDGNEPHYTVMTDQSTDRYRALLTDELGYSIWELEQWSEPVTPADKGGYNRFAEGDSPEELEGALNEILRRDLRQLRRDIESLSRQVDRNHHRILEQ
jgi:hypothetical protein